MVRDLPLLPPLTFPTFGAQIFGSPPIVFFFSFSSTVKLAWGKFFVGTSENAAVNVTPAVAASGAASTSKPPLPVAARL